MPQELCIIHGNCQGDSLAILLGLSGQFRRRFKIRRIVNYLDDAPDREELSHCSLFLYQYMAPRWGEKATDNLLSLLPDSCESICFPNMFFKAYWPFWHKAESVIEFADSFLEKLLAQKLPLPALLNLYNKCDPGLTGDFHEVLSSTLAREREKEEKTPIKYVHLIEENWQKQQMFLTINHPAMPLLVHTANSLLKLMGFDPLDEKLTKDLRHPYDEFWLPIHPGVGRRLSLPFASPDRKYNCFSQKLTFEEYTRYYLACRMNNVVNLTASLAQIPLKKLAESGGRKPENQF